MVLQAVTHLQIKMHEVSGGVPSPPGLPVRHNPGGPPGDSGDDHGGDDPDESGDDTPVHSDDADRPPRKPDGDPNPDGPYDCSSRMYQSMTINKWAKPIPKLDLPPRIHTQKASKIKQDLGDMVCPGSSRLVNMEFLGCPVLE